MLAMLNTDGWQLLFSVRVNPCLLGFGLLKDTSVLNWNQDKWMGVSEVGKLLSALQCQTSFVLFLMRNCIALCLSLGMIL